MKEISIHESDLPVSVVLIGVRGKRRSYLLERATKGFGIFLNAFLDKIRGRGK